MAPGAMSMNRRELLQGAASLVAAARLGMVYSSALAKEYGAADGISTRLVGDQARPWAYGFWVDGNVTKEGITADLQAMKSAGLGGFLFMDGSLGIPSGPHRFMSDSWLEQFGHLVAEAARLGLSIGINNGPGWSGSSGPWITPEDASQVVVHSELVVEGPAQFDDVVPTPAGIRHDYYRDIAVLAYRLPGGVPSHRIEHFESSKSFAGGADFEGVVPWPRFIPTNPDWPVFAAEEVLAEATLQDLSPRLQQGKLRWAVPSGKWLVLRFGHTVGNGAGRLAQSEATGLECDKLSRAALERHIARYLAKLTELGGSHGERVIVATHIDSWEGGSGNWTAGFREEFRHRRGYDLLPYMATLAGFVVGSLERSERFLWDFRETVAELLLQNYAGYMRELARAHGLRLSIEGYDGTCDDLRYAGVADEPMGEFWRSCYSGLALHDTCETAASAAHVYGKPIVGAEAFTALRGDFLDHPATLKPLADWALCVGINRFDLSEWVFQPWMNAAPGITLGDFGTLFGRTLTWWPQSKGWHEYLGRCQQILREGQFIADICFVTPEGAPHRFTPPIPASVRGVVPCRPGYNFDGCPAELVIEQMSVENGELVLPSGMRYRLLVLPTYDAQDELVIRLADGTDYAYKPLPLPKVRTMTPALLKSVQALVERGATVLGWRPAKSPSLAGFPECDREVARLADTLWGVGSGDQGIGERRFGKGRVYWGRTPDEVLSELGVPRDFACSPNLEGMLNYIHRRRIDGTDVYFVVNKSNAALEGTISVRVQGKEPEILWPLTGDSERLACFSERDGVTDLPVSLEANESVFVVLRSAAAADPVVAVSRDGQPVWPCKEFAAASVDPRDDSFIMAAWVQYIAPAIELPSEQDGRLVYQPPLDLPGPSASTFTSPGQGRAGFVVGANGIVVFRYAGDGRLEPLLVHEMPIGGPIHVGVLYERQVPGLFVNGVLVKRGSRARAPLPGNSGWEDRRPFAVEVAALQQFEDMLAAAGIRGPKAAQSHAVDFLQGLAWEPGIYRLTTATGRKRDVEVRLPEPVIIDGPWSVEFDRERGGPGEVRFERLSDWSSHHESGIRYYSGTARYSKRFPHERHLAHDVRVYLDLGRVADLAAVILNGRELGVLWTAPYRFDVTSHLQAVNELEIRVTNRWVNRLIGDAHLPEDTRYKESGTAEAWPDWLLAGKHSPAGRRTFMSQRMWRKEDPLLTSGLLGPVRLRYACGLRGAARPA